MVGDPIFGADDIGGVEGIGGKYDDKIYFEAMWSYVVPKLLPLLLYLKVLSKAFHWTGQPPEESGKE